MPNIKKQIKRAALNTRQGEINSAARREVRTAIKNVETVVAGGVKEDAVKVLRAAVALCDKAAQSGIYSKEKMNHQKARLEKLVAEMK